MSTSTYFILGGAAVGVLLGYHFATTLIMYTPYRQIHGYIAPTSSTQSIVNASQYSGQVTGAAVMAPVQSGIAAGKEIYSEIQNLFGDN